MWSTFFVSLKLTEILNIFLINWNLDTFRSISVFFEGEKMVNYILEIPGLVVFGVKCFNCNTSKFYLRNNPIKKKDDIAVVI